MRFVKPPYLRSTIRFAENLPSQGFLRVFVRRNKQKLPGFIGGNVAYIPLQREMRGTKA